MSGGQQPQSRQQKQRDHQNKGWQAPNDKPYLALGDFQNVISVVEGLKNQIPHSKEMTAETQKMIQKVKRSQNPLFKNGRPDRTLRILAKIPENQQAGAKDQSRSIGIQGNFIDLKGIGEADSTSIMKKMKALEDQFLTQAASFNDQHKQLNQKNHMMTQSSEDADKSHEAFMSNQRLITPAMKKLMNTKDASVMLKDEILESQLRLKAAKYGHKLDEIAPAYDHSFYLPDKTLYFDKSATNVRTSQSLNKQSERGIQSVQGSKSIGKVQNSHLITKTQNGDSIAFMTEPSQQMFNSQQVRESNKNIQDYIRQRTGMNGGQVNQSKGLNQSFYDSFNKNNKSFYSQNAHSLLEASKNQGDSTFYNKAFKTFDAINKLSPRKPKKLNELSIKYRETFHNEGGLGEKAQRRQQSINQKLPQLNQSAYDSKTNDSRLKSLGPDNDPPAIRFVSMIDSKPVMPAYLNLVPLKQFTKKETEMNRIITKESTQGQPIDPMDQNKGAQSSQFNWGKMLNEDLEEIMKKKMDKLHEDSLAKKLQEQMKRKTLAGILHANQESHTTPHIDVTQTETHAGGESNASPKNNNLSKIQLMLLGKLISFESLDTFNAEDLMRKLYNFFFNWQKDIGNEDGVTVTNKNFDLDSDYKGGRGTLSDDQEEKRKRLQLKLDQELIEFEERGGFAKVLRDIFNPSDYNSMELDSVFQLKSLCKAFYEKKEQLSTNLVQTLDAMSNERPKTLLMKKNNLNLDMKSGNLYDDIEWMRINAEKQRISQYRDIAKECAYIYYKVLKKFVEENQNYEKERASEKNNNLIDPQVKLKIIQKEKILKDILGYITDYMRAVIENGNKFTKEHFFMMLKELNSDHIDNQVCKYLKIIIDELEVSAQEFEDFLNALNNDKLGDDSNYNQKSQLLKGIQRVNREELESERPKSGRRNKQSEMRTYASIDPQTDKILQNNLTAHRKSQMHQYSSVVINNARSEINKRYEDGASQISVSDPQMASLIISTLNTDLNQDSRKKKRTHYEQDPQESSKLSKAMDRDTTNVNSTRLNEKKTSINSSRSTQLLPPASNKKRHNRHVMNEESDGGEEDLEATQRQFNPNINTLNIKARKTEILNHNQQPRDLQKQLSISSNVTPLKQMPVTSDFTPNRLDKQTMSARAQGSFSKTILHSTRNRDTLEDFKDSEDDRLRHQPQEMIKGAKSPFKVAVRDSTPGSILDPTQGYNFTSRVTEIKGLERSPQLMSGSRSGQRFGNLFKLQKKTINDEGIAAVDEGLNYSYEKNQKQQQLKTDDQDPVPDTPNSISLKSSQDSEFLKMEYQALKQTYEQIKSPNRKSVNQSLHSSAKKNSGQKKQTNQNETLVSNFQIDEQTMTKRKIEASRLADAKKKSPKQEGNAFRFGRGNRTSAQSSSPLHSMIFQQKQRQQLISYDDNSFERELIEKLKDEKSHDESAILSQRFNKSCKSHRSHKSYKSIRSKSQKKMSPNGKSRLHTSKKAMKIEQKSYGSEESCSTCNNRESRSSSIGSHERQRSKRRASKHSKVNNKSRVSQARKPKQRRNQKNTMTYQSSPMSMPLGQMMMPPQQFPMFGFPQTMMGTTQIMNFQNNYSFQGNPMPYLAAQQQSYYNLLFQQLQSQQKILEQQQMLNQQQNLLNLQNQFQSPTTHMPSHDNSIFSSNIEQAPQHKITSPQQKNSSLTNNLQVPQMSKFKSQNSPSNSIHISQDNNQHIQPQTNFSNQSMDISDQDLLNGAKVYPIAKQKSSQEADSKVRLGSPQSNFSRLDMQSTNMTGDFIGQSVVQSELGSLAMVKKPVAQENIQTQIKEANQQYLNKLKDRSQAATQAATSSITNFFENKSQNNEKSVPRVWEMPIQMQADSRQSVVNSNFNTNRSQESGRGHSLNNQHLNFGLQRASPNRDKPLYTQNGGSIIGIFINPQPTQLEERSQSINPMMIKRGQSVQFKEELNFHQRHSMQRQSEDYVLERFRSPQHERESKTLQSTERDEKKSLDIKNKLKMLNQKLAQGIHQISTEPNVVDRKYSIAESMPLSPSGELKVDLAPYMDTQPQRDHVRYTETEMSRASRQRLNEVFEMNSDKGERSLKPDPIVQSRVISIPFAKRKTELPSTIEQLEQEQTWRTSKPPRQEKQEVIVIPKKVENMRKVPQGIASPRRSIQQNQLNQINEFPQAQIQSESLRSSIVQVTEEMKMNKRPPAKKSGFGTINQKSKANFLTINTEKANSQTQNTSLNGKKDQDAERGSELDKFKKLMTPSKKSTDVLIEIFDKPKRAAEHSQPSTLKQTTAESNAQQSSLADMFKQKLNNKTINMDKRQQQNYSQLNKKQESSSLLGSQDHIEDKLISPRVEKERTKQDILELRKKMMKSTVREKKDNFVNEESKSNNNSMPLELMQRLAKGQKAQIDKQEMKKLNSKIYENLPEVKKKKEEEQKKKDYKDRQAQVKKYAEEIEKKRKQIFNKKQTLTSADI